MQRSLTCQTACAAFWPWLPVFGSGSGYCPFSVQWVDSSGKDGKVEIELMLLDYCLICQCCLDSSKVVSFYFVWTTFCLRCDS